MKQYPQIPRSTGQSFFEFDAYVFDKLDGSNLRFEWAKKRGWYIQGTKHRLFDETDPIYGPALGRFRLDWADTLARIATAARWERAIFFLEYHGPSTLGGLQLPPPFVRLYGDQESADYREAVELLKATGVPHSLHDTMGIADLQADYGGLQHVGLPSIRAMAAALPGAIKDHEAKRLTLFDVNPHKQGFLGPKEFLKTFGDYDIAKFLGRARWTRGFVECVYRGELEGVTFEGVIGKSGHGKDHDLKMAKAKTKAWIDAILARYGEEQGIKLIES